MQENNAGNQSQVDPFTGGPAQQSSPEQAIKNALGISQGVSQSEQQNVVDFPDNIIEQFQASDPANQAEQNTQEPPVDNDQVRYNHWQSEAARKENENKELRERLTQYQSLEPVVQYLQNNPQLVQQAQAGMLQGGQQSQQPQVEEFPDPPPAPKRPSGFSREAAYTEPGSESARYLDEMEEWNTQMAQYNTLRTQYVEALSQQRVEELQANYAKERELQQRQMEANQRRLQARDQVRQQFGLSEQQAAEFVTTMSDPRSISLENLVKLYMINTGQQPVQNTGRPKAPAQPSQDFRQAQNVQNQVGKPFVTAPSANQSTGRSPDQIIGEAMIAMDRKNRDF